jgi:hypothetical protein
MRNGTLYTSRLTGQLESGNYCAYVLLDYQLRKLAATSSCSWRPTGDTAQYFTDRLIAQGKGVWQSSSSLTGTYNLHFARGNYLSLSLGYVRGPALSPRVDDTLTFTLDWGLYL